MTLALNPYHSALLTYGGSALVVMMLLILIAVWRFRIWVQLGVIAFGILLIWAGLFFGSELGYRSWQSMPDPPDEAFADTAPMGFLIGGWVPGIMATLSWWGALLLVRNLIRGRDDTPEPPPVNLPKAPPTAPPESP